MRLLILGGTTQASALARAMVRDDRVETILSYAGRTENPAEPAVPFRVGGFGGPEGLAAFLIGERIDAVVDATHPFAARISAHAVVAAHCAGLPLAIFTRPPWHEECGDDWCRVANLDAAALALGPVPKRVFLTSGRLGLAAFKRAPHHHYLVRSIDPPAPEDRPPLCEVVLARGPFDVSSEAASMRRHGIEILVSKNSGGEAGKAKLQAARALRLPVVMVERPSIEQKGEVLTEIDAVLAFVERHRAASSSRGPPA